MRYLSGYDLALDTAINPRDIIPVVPNAMDDEFNDSSFDTGKWTWLDQGGWTVAETDERAIFTGPVSDGNRIRGVYQALPAAPCAFEAKIYLPASASAGQLACLFIAENITGGVAAHGVFSGTTIRGVSFATPSSAAGALGDIITITNLMTNPFFYSRIEWDGTDYLISYSISPSGGWVEQHSASPAWTPTLIGLGFANNTASIGRFPFGWFRRVL